MMAIIISSLLGAIAGFFNSFIFPDRGFGKFGNMIVGGGGAYLTYIFVRGSGIIMLSSFLASIITAFVGSLFFLAMVNFLFEHKKEETE